MFARKLVRIVANRIPPSLPFASSATSSAAVEVEFNETPSNGIDDFLRSLVISVKSIRSPRDVHSGKQCHARAIINGMENDGAVGTSLLGMYVLCGSLSDSNKIFFRLEKDHPLRWNWMIRGFIMNGLFDFALLFFFKMFFVGVFPDNYTYTHVFKACCCLSAMRLGRLIHSMIWFEGHSNDVHVGSSLVKMYAENGCIKEARVLFDEMLERDCVLWNVMIDGYVRCRESRKAIELFLSMRRSGSEPNYVSFTCILSACSTEGMLVCGVQIHGVVFKYGLESEASVSNTLLAFYSKCRCVSEVRKLFLLMPETDLVSWNGMISGYVQNGMKEDALGLFYQMQEVKVRPNSITLASLLPAFSDSSNLRQGKEIHSYMVRNMVDMDAYLKSALIDIYFKCKDVRTAKNIYDSSEIMDVVICSAMISGYVLNGMNSDALKMFRKLIMVGIKPNPVTIASALPACSSLNAMKLGMELHCYALKNAYNEICYTASALLDMYAKVGRVDLAHIIFKNISVKDSVAWNSMLASFAQNGQPEEAIHLFRQMGIERTRYDSVSISSALSSCANLPALHIGKEIHGYMIRADFMSDLFAESALIDMYAKCGNLGSARRIFDLMLVKNEVSWNSIIAAYGSHGLVEDVMYLFNCMIESGLQPDHVTFLAVISACSHASRIKEGFEFFSLMQERYRINPRMEHYACMVDLFGRSGRLREALGLIMGMPFEPDAGIWGALLGACRVYRNVELAELALKKLLEIDPQNSGYYVLMSNLNAVTGQWEGVLKMRSMMKKMGVQKSPGCSWIEIGNKPHMFIAADKSHSESDYVYFTLKSLLIELKVEGYIAQTELVHPETNNMELHII